MEEVLLHLIRCPVRHRQSCRWSSNATQPHETSRHYHSFSLTRIIDIDCYYWPGPAEMKAINNRLRQRHRTSICLFLSSLILTVDLYLYRCARHYTALFIVFGFIHSVEHSANFKNKQTKIFSFVSSLVPNIWLMVFNVQSTVTCVWNSTRHSWKKSLRACISAPYWKLHLSLMHLHYVRALHSSSNCELRLIPLRDLNDSHEIYITVVRCEWELLKSGRSQILRLCKIFGDL